MGVVTSGWWNICLIRVRGGLRLPPLVSVGVTQVSEGPVLITGASGLLGTWLRRTSSTEREVVSLVHRRPVPGRRVAADLRDRDAVNVVFETTGPRLVIHAAFARDEASIVDATRHVAEAAHATGADLILISSEAVFSGDGGARSETSTPDPVWAYGRWKTKAEALVTATDSRAAIVRLPLIVSAEPEDHILSAIRAASRRGEPSVWFTDEVRQPAHADELAQAVWAIAALPPEARAGAWHLPGRERLSRFEIAARTVDAAGLDRSRILAAPSPPDAGRPLDLNLTGKRAQRLIGWSPRPVHRMTPPSAPAHTPPAR